MEVQVFFAFCLFQVQTHSRSLVAWRLSAMGIAPQYNCRREITQIPIVEPVCPSNIIKYICVFTIGGEWVVFNLIQRNLNIYKWNVTFIFSMRTKITRALAFYIQIVSNSRTATRKREITWKYIKIDDLRTSSCRRESDLAVKRNEPINKRNVRTHFTFHLSFCSFGAILILRCFGILGPHKRRMLTSEECKRSSSSMQSLCSPQCNAMWPNGHRYVESNDTNVPLRALIRNCAGLIWAANLREQTEANRRFIDLINVQIGRSSTSLTLCAMETYLLNSCSLNTNWTESVVINFAY